MGTAIYAGITGLLAHQRRLDVVANNISNVNTYGYRGARALFQDLFSETLQGARAGSATIGAGNPMQVGLGVKLSDVDVSFTQGSLVTTGVASDLAIQGSGFFVLGDGTTNFYTRDGSFTVSTDGTLIDPATGLSVRGYMADSNGQISANAAPTNITIPIGGASVVRPTSTATLVGNLDSASVAGTTVERSLRVYDSLGTARDVRLVFTKRAQVTVGSANYNAWDWQATYTNQDATPVTTTVGSGTLLFDTSGKFFNEGTVSGSAFTARAAGTPAISITNAALGTLPSYPADPLAFQMGFSSMSELAGSTDVTVSNQDGITRGVLESFNIGRDGVINGVYTNGLTRTVGQVALATFANLGGLMRSGNNLFAETPSSGAAQIGLSNTGGRGEVSGGVLEGSNVDLGTEFSNMIVTQRGYQANARTITSADNMMQEAVNLIR